MGQFIFSQKILVLMEHVYILGQKHTFIKKMCTLLLRACAHAWTQTWCWIFSFSSKEYF